MSQLIGPKFKIEIPGIIIFASIGAIFVVFIAFLTSIFCYIQIFIKYIKTPGFVKRIGRKLKRGIPSTILDSYPKETGSEC